MKRPFAVVGFAYLLGLLAVFFTSEEISLVFLLVLAVLGVAVALARRGSRVLWLSLAGFFAAVAMAVTVGALVRAAFDPYVGEASVIKGKIVQEMGEDSNAYQILVDKVDEVGVRPFYIQLYAGRQLRFKPWDSIGAKVEFRAFADETGQSVRKSRLAEGLVLSAASQGAIAIETAGDMRGLFLNLKQSLQNSIDRLLSEDAADLLSAMLLGEGDRVNQGLYADFQAAGVNHILVISGMHMSVIAGCTLLLLGKLPMPRRLRLLLTIGVILLYMAVTGFGKSVTRSGLMYLMLLASQLVGEESDGLNSLGFSVLAIGLANPYSAMDVGFLLSVTATAGILVLSGRIRRRLMPPIGARTRRVLRPAVSALSVSLAAFLFITPVLLLFFGVVNPLSVPVSVLLSLPGSAFLVCGALMALMGLFSPAMAAPLAILVRLLAKLMVQAAGLGAHLGGLIPSFSGEAAVLAFMGLLLVLALCITGKKRQRMLGALLCLLILATAVIEPYTAPVRLIAEDTGSGMVVSLVKGRQAVVLCAQGRNRGWAGYHLKRLGVNEIHTLHLSDNDELWYGEKLAERFATRHIVARDTIALTAPATRYGREYRFSPFEGVQVDIALFGRMITADIYGQRLVVLKDGASGQGADGDVAVVSGSTTKINCRFTIILSDDIIGLTSSGNYISGLGETLCVTFGADGNMGVRRLG